MYRRYLNARSPLRLLEKGLHGGLQRGDLGLVLAAHGVGKTPFLVGVALDDLLRGAAVLHVSLEQGVSHVRTFYDAVFDDLAATAHLQNAATERAAVDRLRRIRSYPPEEFTALRLREALELESQIGNAISLVVVDGLDPGTRAREEICALRDVARECKAEIWVSAPLPEEHAAGLPASLAPSEEFFAVILALEPRDDEVVLRALKDRDNPDVSTLHVGLDPKTLLLIRA